MKQPLAPLGRPFLTVWIGQTISEIGSMLSGVAAAVYVFLETGSATWLGIMSAVGALPAVLVGAAGSQIDRYPRRQVMIAGDCVAALAPTVVLVFALTGRLQIWHLVVAGFVAGLGNAAQTAASQAAVPALVDEDQLERAHALKQLGAGAGVVIGPIAATPLLVHWGIEIVLLVDLATFVVGIVTVALVRFVDPPRQPDLDDDGSWLDMWSWLRGPGVVLLGILVVACTLNLTLAFFNIAILVAATIVGGAAKAGLVLGLGGFAMIAGSIVAAGRRRSSDRIGRISVSLGVVGLGFVVAGSRPSMWVQAIGVAIALAAVPTIGAAFAALFNERVPAQMQGRVFALRGGLAQVVQSGGSLVAGVAIAHWAEPAMQSGMLAGSLGRLLGAGPSSGAQLLLVAAGVGIATIGFGLSRSPVRAALRTTTAVPPAQSPEAAVSAKTPCRSRSSAGVRRDG